MLITRVDFGKVKESKILVRLLANHVVTKDGTKYRKDNGHMVGGNKYRGVYVESTWVEISTLSLGTIKD